MADDDDAEFEKSLHVDIVSVMVSGDDPDRVAEEFDDAVEQAFEKYEEYVAGRV